MKRIIKIILVLMICLSVKVVYADNYKIKELIPFNTHTTIHTDNFSYKDMYFDEKGVHFGAIKNLADWDLSISISIGLFDKSGVNIGTINYCDSTLKSKEEIEYSIDFDKTYLADKKTVKDIRYISVLSDNINCRVNGSGDYVGQNVDKLGVSHSGQLDNKTQLFLSIITVVFGTLIVLFIYKFVFTNKYRNVDGKEVRDAFDNINKELSEMRYEAEMNKPAPPPKEPNKPSDILEQEEEAKNEDKSGTDLHNLYK